MSVVTVTTTTVVVATATLGVAAALGAIGTCIFISALIGKELSTSYEDEDEDHDHSPTIKERLKSLIGSLTEYRNHAYADDFRIDRD